MAYIIKKDIDAEIFRTYDIRGIVDQGLTEDSVYTIGLSLGKEALAVDQHKVIVGRDGRLSGPKFIKAMIEGLTDAGCDVIDLGAVTTPILYFSTNVLETKSGIMITGSHNPPEYNGIKIVINGKTLCEDSVQQIYRNIVSDSLVLGKKGSVTKYDIKEQYINYVANIIKLEKPLKIVIDCGNGIGSNYAPDLYRRLGCEVIELFCEVDGSFPNHHPDPSIAKNLQDLIKAVKEHKADIGLGFDGDADRIGVVTNKGEIIWPDRHLLFLARDVLKNYPGAYIPYDVKCTKNMAPCITKFGGKPNMGRTGHALLKARMHDLNSPIAGELSGHIFYKDRWFGFDDGLYVGARLLEILAKLPCSASEAFAQIPDTVNTPELKVMISEEEKFGFMKEFTEKAKFEGGQVITIDGVRVEFSDGFGLLRASNTTPALTVRFEGDSPEALERIKKVFHDQVKLMNPKLELPF